jgi:hypothetical protein
MKAQGLWGYGHRQSLGIGWGERLSALENGGRVDRDEARLFILEGVDD